MTGSGKVKKGIILAGGNGTRLFPMTQVACKQLLPVYDKPLIYYPLGTLMQFDIREILIISTPTDIHHFRDLFGDGMNLGLSIKYAVQERPEGIAQAFIIAGEFIGDDPVALILGDNIFYGVADFRDEVQGFDKGALIFGYYMKDPRRYGVISFNDNGEPGAIEEKPAHPGSNYAVTGFYIYDADVVGIAAGLKPSARGELEITDINNEYLNRGRLGVIRLGRGVSWLDTGTTESMLTAANFISTMEKRQGIKLGCIEEIAFSRGFIDNLQFRRLIEAMPFNEYRDYLAGILEEYDNA
ncbi:MAG: glucose-1-phosphate thymidylyltransferase [candidate division Zixibacteria bacterium HGW-Zixibacteria-1]|nr:MAG: glucose-1-phosphate thymidylyltransferase [candidate division Zixibacteria bacterium HGW-Zixibacteria-1]